MSKPAIGVPASKNKPQGHENLRPQSAAVSTPRLSLGGATSSKLIISQRERPVTATTSQRPTFSGGPAVPKPDSALSIRKVLDNATKKKSLVASDQLRPAKTAQSSGPRSTGPSPTRTSPPRTSPLRTKSSPQEATSMATRRPSVVNYADERSKAAKSLQQAMEMLGRTSKVEVNADTRDASDPTSPAYLSSPESPEGTQKYLPSPQSVQGAAESSADRARRLLMAAKQKQSAENLLLGHLRCGVASHIDQKHEPKRLSLVSSEVLNTFKSKAVAFRRSSAPEAQGSEPRITKEMKSFDQVLMRVASADRLMSPRTRKLLGLLPQSHAGNQAVNGSVGTRGVLTHLKKTRETLAQDMAAVSSVLKNSGSLLQRHFRGLTSRQLSARIRITFQTYDRSNDGLLQFGELYEALTNFGMDVDEAEVGAFCDIYGTNGELNPRQFETMVRVAMGLDNAEDVEEDWKRARSSEGDTSQTIVDSCDGATFFTRASSAPEVSL